MACGLLLLAAALPQLAGAFTVSIGGSLASNLYLQIGVGNGGTYTAGSLGNNSTVNTVSVSVPAGVVGNGTAQAMTANGPLTSAYNGRTFCNANQLYIGAYYQPFLLGVLGSGSSTVTVTVPAVLSDASGNTIPFSAISWTSSGIGDSVGEPFPGGTFAPGTTQTIGSIGANQWAESCWTFSYANSSVFAAGTYTATVTYTAASP